MKRSRLHKIFLKDKTETNRKNYKTQRKFCKTHFKSTKKSYFDTLDTKKNTDNRTFWKAVLHHFPQKVSKGKKTNLTEKGNVISRNEEICSTFNYFFENAVSNLNIPAIEHFHSNLQNTDPILATFNSYEILTKLVKSFIN